MVDNIVILNDNSMSQNTYLIFINEGVYIIDPGLNGELIENKIDGKKILGTFLTHFHFDHVAGIEVIQTLSDSPIFIHEKDYESLFTDNLSRDFWNKEIVIDPKYIEKLFGAKGVVNELVSFFINPGHSPGSVTYKIDDNLFTGDMLFANTIGRSDLYNSDSNDIMKSLDLFSGFDDSIVVYPGHGPSSVFKNIRIFNKFFNN